MRTRGTSSLTILAALAIALGGCGDDSSDAETEGSPSGSGSGTSTDPAGGSGGGGNGGGGVGVGGPVGTAATGDAQTATSSTTGTGSSDGCIGADLLGSLDRDHVMVGASLGDELAATTPLDLRYIYLSGSLPDGTGPCDTCATNCATDDVPCANPPDGGAGGCGWWGCWQYDQDPPGAYVRNFAATARANGQIPMVTYYLVLQASGAGEGVGEINAVSDPVFLQRYLADFRFVLENLAGGTALVHVEPDFWGYAQQLNPDPHAIPAAVPAANPEDCGAEEATLAGLGRCFVKMARIHAPSVKIGLHGSGWATAVDVLQNADPNLDVALEAAELGTFLAETAPDADLIFIDAADRDAGFYASEGRETWWDDTNATLPSFNQAFAWAKGVSETTSKPNLWWQLPFGNMSLPGGSGQWNDNRLDYFFSHMSDVAAAHGAGIAFGAGAGGQVTAETDNGNFVAKASAYASTGGAPLCEP